MSKGWPAVSDRITEMSSTGKSPIANVLIADDEDNQRSGLEAMVSAWGYRAETACDGREALDKLGRFPADVLITDLMMPRMDGMALLQGMREQGMQIPAIVTTAFGNIETAVKTIHDLGAFWFLEKPIQPSVLKVLLERAAAQSNLAGERERLRRALSYPTTRPASARTGATDAPRSRPGTPDRRAGRSPHRPTRVTRH